MRRRPVLIILLLLAALAAVLVSVWSGGGPDPKPAPPPDRALRIVPLSPALAVIARDLGLEPSIVGRHGFDLVLDKSLPVCGDQAGIDYEALVRARPTHLLIEWGDRPLPDRLRSLGETNHWRILEFEMLTLDQVAECVRSIEFELVKRPQLEREGIDPSEFMRGSASAGWSDLQDRLARALRHRPGLGMAGRILLLESTDPPAALGPGSFHHQVLGRIGATPALEEGSPYIRMDAEDILRVAPDAIIVFRPRPYRTPAPAPPSADDIRRALGPVAGLSIPAIDNRRIAVIDDPLCLLPGTSLIDTAESMARVIEEWSR